MIAQYQWEGEGGGAGAFNGLRLPNVVVKQEKVTELDGRRQIMDYIIMKIIVSFTDGQIIFGEPDRTRPREVYAHNYTGEGKSCKMKI